MYRPKHNFFYAIATSILQWVHGWWYNATDNNLHMFAVKFKKRSWTKINISTVAV